MWKTIKSLLASRKALMAVLSSIVWAVGKVGLELDADELYPVVLPLWGYVLGQSVADAGKEGTLARLAAAAKASAAIEAHKNTLAENKAKARK